MSFNVTSPWALYGFTKLNGYATGVALTRNLVSGLGLHPGVEPLENGVKGPCKTSPSDEGDETMDAPGASPCLALRTLGFGLSDEQWVSVFSEHLSSKTWPVSSGIELSADVSSLENHILFGDEGAGFRNSSVPEPKEPTQL